MDNEEQGLTFDFTDPDSEKRVAEARQHLSQIKIDWKAKYIDGVDPKVEFENLAEIKPETVKEVEDTARKAGKILGLFEKQSKTSSIPVWEPRIIIPTQEEFAQTAEATTRAYEQHNSITLNPRTLDAVTDIEDSKALYKHLLGEDVSAESNEAKRLNRFLVMGSVVHEMYHIRQKRILHWREVLGPNKRKATENENRYSIIENHYIYNEGERGARSFQIRYLKEVQGEFDPASDDYKILGKLIEHLTNSEILIAEDRKYFGKLRREERSNN